MITVIIPTHNSAGTISRCLKSLVDQTHQNFRVIVVDDHSDDFVETKSTIDEFSKKLLIDFYRLKSKGNGSVARNYGIDKTRTPYICFLDSDDYWTINRIEQAYNSIQGLKQEDIIEYSCYQISSSGFISPRRPLRRDELVSEYVFFSDMSMQTSTFLVSTGIAKSVRFDEQLSRHQDSSFMMRAQMRGHIIRFRNSIINNYVISGSEFKERVKSGRITPDFCDNFMEKYAGYFSKKAKLGYLFNVYLRVAIISRLNVKKVLIGILKTGMFYSIFQLALQKVKKRVVSIHSNL